jgi:Fe-S-cluster containining protein
MSETDNTPWYRDGLCFSCTQCGNCCTGDPGVVWVTEEELADIARLTGKSLGEIRLFHTRIVGGRVSLREHANGDCTFFDGEKRTCTIYDARPTQCRTWPFWKSHLQSPATWEEVKRECPGAGQGDFFSLEEVERRAGEMEI